MSEHTTPTLGDELTPQPGEQLGTLDADRDPSFRWATDVALDALTAARPVQIDAELARLLNERGDARAAADLLADQRQHVILLNLHAAMPALRERRRRAQQRLKDCARTIQLLVAEYHRRGGWPRAWQARGGQVHRSTACPACDLATDLVWLTDLSGQDDDEVLHVVGDDACRTCFPVGQAAALK